MSCSKIQALAQRLKEADLANSQEQREIFEGIREIRSTFDGPLDPESQRSLEAASMLVAYLARMGNLAGEDVRSIAARLLETAYELESGAGALLSEARRAGLAPPEHGTPPPAAAPAPPGTPRMHVLRSSQPPTSLTLQGEAPRASAEGERRERTATDALGDMMLGQILLRRGQILEEHIHQAAKVQRTTGLRIGDIFVKIGAATRAQVADALAYQAACRRTRESLPEPAQPVGKAEPRGTGLKLMGEVLLGEILVERGAITRRQLERALEVQRSTGLRIGEALVKSGATTQENIEHALRLQSQDRRFGPKPGAGSGPGEQRR
jgi:hypothetical protein